MDKATASSQHLQEIATNKLGIDELRPGQETAVRAILAGRDVLAVMPTGWGKSAVYQLAGLLLNGPTLIVSPLIAIQNDQVESIRAMDIGRAEVLNSQLSAGKRGELLESFAERDVDFLFLTPEQLQNEEVVAHLVKGKPALFVVDEAHCICEWGHDFRPDYARLGAALENLGRPRVLALTATAAPPVRREIVDRLSMDQPLELVLGFDRPNISLHVLRFESEEAQRDCLLEEVVAADKPGIVYTGTRRSCEAMTQSLAELGIAVVAYHGGLNKAARDEAQARWMNGEAEVVVATTAFGMGIDKADVRWVYHLHIAESLDAYYQEIGRSGRDGEPAKAVLFYRQADLGLRRFFASGSTLTNDDLEPVVDALAESDDAVEVEDIQNELDLPEAKVAAAVRLLEQSGVVEQDGDERIQPTEEIDQAETIENALALQERFRQFDRSRVEMMQAYAETNTCRREFILSYFGEKFEGPCNACDNCRRAERKVIDKEAKDESGKPFALGSRVSHSQWGLGQVLRYEDDKLIVLFDEAGYKTLDVNLVCEKELLMPA